MCVTRIASIDKVQSHGNDIDITVKLDFEVNDAVIRLDRTRASKLAENLNLLLMVKENDSKNN